MRGLYFILFYSISIFTMAQVNGFTNSSFEYTSNCVNNLNPSHSQFGNVMSVWENMLSNNTSTADNFTATNLCNFTNFTTQSNSVSLASNTASHGCSWAGIYLNYFDGSSSSLDDKYREYIGQRVDLKAGITYTIDIDLAHSNDPTSSNLEADFGIYGYNGPIPASHFDYCILNGDGTNATLLGSVTASSIQIGFQTYTISFTPTQDFDYLVFGGSSCSITATATGYVFIDNVRVFSSNNAILNPIIESFGSNNRCNFYCLKESFTLTGNSPNPGVNMSWSQSPSNPEQLTFTSPNASTTNILEQGSFVEGEYEFYYTFNNGTSIVTDTLRGYIYGLTFMNGFGFQSNLSGCNTINDVSELVNRQQTVIGLPNDAAVTGQYLTSWWSMIRNDGTEWVFPNGCIPGDGLDEGDVFIDPFVANCGTRNNGSTSSSQVEFYFRNAQDTVSFIWHVQKTDECNNLIVLIDTQTVYINDFDLGFSGPIGGDFIDLNK